MTSFDHGIYWLLLAWISGVIPWEVGSMGFEQWRMEPGLIEGMKMAWKTESLSLHR